MTAPGRRWQEQRTLPTLPRRPQHATCTGPPIGSEGDYPPLLLFPSVPPAPAPPGWNREPPSWPCPGSAPRMGISEVGNLSWTPSVAEKGLADAVGGGGAAGSPQLPTRR